MKAKLEEVLAGRAREYREPLAALQSSMQTRTRMAGVGFSGCLSQLLLSFFTVGEERGKARKC